MWNTRVEEPTAGWQQIALEGFIRSSVISYQLGISKFSLIKPVQSQVQEEESEFKCMPLRWLPGSLSKPRPAGPGGQAGRGARAPPGAWSLGRRSLPLLFIAAGKTYFFLVSCASIGNYIGKSKFQMDSIVVFFLLSELSFQDGQHGFSSLEVLFCLRCSIKMSQAVSPHLP